MLFSLSLGIFLFGCLPFLGNSQTLGNSQPKPDSGITIQVTQIQYGNGTTVTNNNNVGTLGQNQTPQANKNGNQSPPTTSKPGDYMFEVSFSPHTSYRDDVPTAESIKHMLKVIQTKFNYISTSSMAADAEHNESLISRLAAQVNQESKATRLKVCQGAKVFKNGQEQKDLDLALDASRTANSMWRGTVWGISLNADNQWGSIQDAEDILHVHSILQQNFVRRAHELGLKVGAKLDICSEIVDGLNKDKISELAKSCDFVSCFVFPSRGTEAAMDGVANIVQIYEKYRNAFLQVNPNLDVIIETGWASSGESDFNPEQLNTVGKQREFWERMEATAKEKGMKVRMFEAFDQPTTRKELYKHFGYWMKVTANTENYIEKGTGKITQV